MKVYAVVLATAILTPFTGLAQDSEMTSVQIDAMSQLSELEWMAGLQLLRFASVN